MPSDRSSSPPPFQPPPLVLDTNVLLDWLVFHDPCTLLLEGAIRSGAWRWVATPAMRTELEQVLTRKHLLARQPDPRSALAAWDEWAHIVAEPAPVAAPSAMRCTDADDQKFIDLALQLGAALLSRDNAVLRLAGAGRRHGVRILTPADWAASLAADSEFNG